MKHLLSFTVFLLLACVISFTEALSAVPSFELNLDLPPNQRWNGAVQTIVDAHGWDHSFAPVLDLYLPITWVIPQSVMTAFKQIMATRFPDYYGEMQGIYAQLVKIGQVDKLASADQFTAIAFAYEILHAVPQDIISIEDPALRKIAQHIQNQLQRYSGEKSSSFVFKKACTGILALPTNMSADIIHGRNMDEQPSPARNLTLKITATRNNGQEVAWEALDWLWFSSGVETSQRQGGVTMELNYRDFFNGANSKNFTWSELSTRLLEPSNVPVLLFHRYVHERKMTYDDLVSFALFKGSFAAPFYCIASGTNRRGVVLTLHNDRTRSFAAEINDTANYHESDGLSWALLQTNYDILNGQPDNAGDDRRTVAQNTLKMLGRERGSTELGVYMTLSVFPVHNRDTFYTALLSVSKPIEGYVRRSMIPDPEFPLR